MRTRATSASQSVITSLGRKSLRLQAAENPSATVHHKPHKRISKKKNSARALRLSESYKSSHSVGRRSSSSFTIYSQQGGLFYDLYARYTNSHFKVRKNDLSIGSPLPNTRKTSVGSQTPSKASVSSLSKQQKKSDTLKRIDVKREAGLNAVAKMNILCSVKKTPIKKKLSKKKKIEKKILRELGITVMPTVSPKVKRMASINAVALISAVTHDPIHRNPHRQVNHEKSRRYSTETIPCNGSTNLDLTVEITDDHDDAATVPMCISPELKLPLIESTPVKSVSRVRGKERSPNACYDKLRRIPCKKVTRSNVCVRSGATGSSLESIRTERVVPLSCNGCSFQQITHQVIHIANQDCPVDHSLKSSSPLSTGSQTTSTSNSFPKATVTQSTPVHSESLLSYYSPSYYENHSILQTTSSFPQFFPVNYVTNWQSQIMPPTMTYNVPSRLTQPTLTVHPQSLNYIYPTPFIFGSVSVPSSIVYPPVVIQNHLFQPLMDPTMSCLMQLQHPPTVYPLLQSDLRLAIKPAASSTMVPMVSGMLQAMPPMPDYILRTSSLPVQANQNNDINNIPPQLSFSASQTAPSSTYGVLSACEVSTNPQSKGSIPWMTCVSRDSNSHQATIHCSATPMATPATINTCISYAPSSNPTTIVMKSSSKSDPHVNVMGTANYNNSSGSWLWEGEAFKKLVFFQSDSAPVMCLCYKAIRHRRDGMVIREKDNVFVCSGPDRSKPPHVAKITALFADQFTGTKMMAVLWYYRPEHVFPGHNGNSSSSGPLAANSQKATDDGAGSNAFRSLDHINRLYASRHCDVNSVECIEDRAYVLTRSAYARFMAEISYRQSGSPRPPLRHVVPKRPRLPSAASNESIEGDLVAETVSDHSNTDSEDIDRNLPTPDLIGVGNVFICQGVYDYKLRRLLRTAPTLQATIWGQHIQSRIKPLLIPSNQPTVHKNQTIPLRRSGLADLHSKVITTIKATASGSSSKYSLSPSCKLPNSPVIALTTVHPMTGGSSTVSLSTVSNDTDVTSRRVFTSPSTHLSASNCCNNSSLPHSSLIFTPLTSTPSSSGSRLPTTTPCAGGVTTLQANCTGAPIPIARVPVTPAVQSIISDNGQPPVWPTPAFSNGGTIAIYPNLSTPCMQPNAPQFSSIL